MAKKQHIVHLIGRPNGGGVQKMVLGLATSHALKEFRHSIICVNESTGGFRDIYRNHGINVYSCPRYWPSHLPSYRAKQWLKNHSFSSRLKLLMSILKPDIVHFQQLYDIYLQYEATRSLGLPWLLTLHGMTRSINNLPPKTEIMIDGIEQSSGFLTAVSNAALEDFLTDEIRFGTVRDRVAVIYNGLSIRDFLGAKEQREAFRRGLNIGNDTVLFGMTSAMIPLKRHDLAVVAAANLIKGGAGLHLAFAGDGPFVDRTKNLVSSLGISSNVHFMGWLNDIRSFLGGLDVFLMLSDTEGFPMSLLEALASGIPSIATRVGGMPEILGKGGGILTERGSLDGLTEAMRVMLDPIERKSYATEAQNVAKEFSIEKTASQYASIYYKLLNKNVI